MLRFRTTAIAVSMAMWSALAFLAATHKISFVLPSFEPGPIISVVVPYTPPAPTPPPPLPIPKADPVVAQQLDLANFTPTPIPVTAPHTAPTAPADLVGATWLKRPGAREFDRYYPTRAVERDREGRVTLNCTVNADGTIACIVADESPQGWGFGEAAIQISKFFMMAPQTINGAPTSGGKISVPITFKLGG